MIAGPLLVMLIATENPVPQSLFTVYVTWHTGAAAAAAACAAAPPPWRERRSRPRRP